MFLTELGRLLPRRRANVKPDHARRRSEFLPAEGGGRSVHRRLPDRHREIAAEGTWIDCVAAAGQESRPYSAGDALVVADEPGIREAGGRAALAGTAELLF